MHFRKSIKNNTFGKHCTEVISKASLDVVGEPNPYLCKWLMVHMEKYILPYTGLLTEIMLGKLFISLHFNSAGI